MTVNVPEPLLAESSASGEEREPHEGDCGSLKLDGGFAIPDVNVFGQTFRDFETETERSGVIELFYKINHMHQTYDFARKKKEEYGQLNRAVMSIWECCEVLNEFVDESDPDLDEPQIEHLLQSAEAIRRDYPDEDWLHLTALVHDLGKILLHAQLGGQPQWCVVGDTFPLGCAFDELIVHHQYFKENPDYSHPVYSTKLGVYAEKCGLDNVTMSWGHDEYMYLVMKENGTTLPPAALFIVRFHSFHALHLSGAYTYLMNDDDREMLKLLQIFSKYDLYSKSRVRINLEEVKPYYLSLINKYFKENPHYSHPVYSTKLGVYAEKCGLENVTMSWGHDEYIYLVIKENGTTLPPAARFIVRVHSFHALHRSSAYTYLMNDYDREMLKLLQIFCKYDLYSKSRVRIKLEEVKPYYHSLINKYFPGEAEMVKRCLPSVIALRPVAAAV